MMQRRDILIGAIGWAMLGAGCAASPPPSQPRIVTLADPTARVSSTDYARSVTGIDIAGEPSGWWDGADGRYPRGGFPRKGSVLVFRRSPLLPSGHVAIVTAILSRREIRVSHADWPSTWATRGRITSNVPIVDASAGNDWTEVRVWYAPTGTFGRRYAAHGFVYRNTGTEI